MSLSKELPKCFVCFKPTEKFGETDNTFLSVVMFLRLKGQLPYPPEGSPVLIKDWETCGPCVPKTLDLYKEYAKLQEEMKRRGRRGQFVKEGAKKAKDVVTVTVPALVGVKTRPKPKPIKRKRKFTVKQHKCDSCGLKCCDASSLNRHKKKSCPGN